MKSRSDDPHIRESPKLGAHKIPIHGLVNQSVAKGTLGLRPKEPAPKLASYKNTNAISQNQQLTEERFSGSREIGFVPPFSSAWVSGPPLMDVSFFHPQTWPPADSENSIFWHVITCASAQKLAKINAFPNIPQEVACPLSRR
jgi:hypothetical protein